MKGWLPPVLEVWPGAKEVLAGPVVNSSSCFLGDTAITAPLGFVVVAGLVLAGTLNAWEWAGS